MGTEQVSTKTKKVVTKRARKPQKSDVFTRSKDGTLKLKIGRISTETLTKEKDDIRKCYLAISSTRPVLSYLRSGIPIPKSWNLQKIADGLTEAYEILVKKSSELNGLDNEKVTLS